MNDVCCPDCHGSKLIKCGKDGAGRQKYRCCDPGCRRRFVEGSSRVLDRHTKKIILQLLASGVEPRKIHGALSEGTCSLRWIYELRRLATPIVHRRNLQRRGLGRGN
jgi:transposase-like protein